MTSKYVKPITIWAVGLFFAAALASVSQAAAKMLTVETVKGQPPVIDAVIKGERVKLLLDLSGPRYFVLNDEVARRAGLKSFGLVPVTAIFDKEKIKGKATKSRIEIDRIPSFRRRVLWFPGHRYVQEYDGIVGPSAIKEIDRLIVVQTGGAKVSAKSRPIKISGDNGLYWSAAWPVIADEKVELRFDLYRRSRANAAAIGQLSDRGLLIPDKTPPQLRPFRHFGRDRLSLDFKGNNLTPFGIPVAGVLQYLRQKDVAAYKLNRELEGRYGQRLEELLITADGKGDKPTPLLTLGKDVLSYCETIEFDYKSEAIMLNCASPS